MVSGPAGRIESVVDAPDLAPGVAAHGVVVIAHPHPLFGGTMDNKVVQTLARAFVQCGWQAVRFNFRGVGATEGVYDEGRGELQDLLALVQQVAPQGPLALAGFSFGGYVAAQAHARLTEAAANRPELVAPKQLVLISPATSRYEVPEVPAHTLVVEGEQDDVVPLASILDWARPQGLPITVVPGTGHFFHGKLTVLREVVLRHLRAAAV